MHRRIPVFLSGPSFICATVSNASWGVKLCENVGKSLELITKQTHFYKMTKAAFLWSDLDQGQWSNLCLDHGASKEQMNPWPEWIYRFLWCDIIQADLRSLIRIRITPKERSLKSFASVDSPSPCWITLTDLFKIRHFPQALSKVFSRTSLNRDILIHTTEILLKCQVVV